MEKDKINGWGEAQIHVMSELRDAKKNQTDMMEKLVVIEIKLGKLETAFKIKSGIWGLVAGALVSIPVGIATILFVLSKLS